MLVVGPPEVEVLVGLYVVPALEYRPVAAVRVHVTVCFNCGLDRTEEMDAGGGPGRQTTAVAGNWTYDSLHPVQSGDQLPETGVER